MSSEERWADVVDGCVTEDSDGLEGTLQVGLLGHGDGSTMDSVAVETSGNANLLSVGSRHHNAGRCKPCAFFHTKGCNSGESCLFCHLCPAHEKQRRKRLRRQLCHNLLSSFDVRERHYKLAGQSGFNAQATHSRQPSNASVTTASTWAGNPEEKRQHARQWSSSTQESVGGSSANLPYVAPQAAEQSMLMFNQSPSGVMHRQRISFPVISQSAGQLSMPLMNECTQTLNNGETPPWGKAEEQLHRVAIAGSKLDPCEGLPADIAAPREQAQMPLEGARAWPVSLAEAVTAPSQSMPGAATTPAGSMAPTTSYMTYAGVQYALVPVAVPQYNSGCCGVPQPDQLGHQALEYGCGGDAEWLNTGQNMQDVSQNLGHSMVYDPWWRPSEGGLQGPYSADTAVWW